MDLVLSILARVGTFVLFFAVLVFCHELGHFLFAKLFGMRVEEFALGMGKPKLRVWFDGVTEYTLRAIPIGGFVRIAGMEIEDAYERKLTGADDARESLQTTNVSTMSQEAEEVSGIDPNGFNARPIFQRFLVILAGPVFSLFFGYLAFCFCYLFFGIRDAPATNQVMEVTPKSPAMVAGIRAGDTILAINGQSVKDGDELVTRIRSTDGKPIVVTIRPADAAATVQKPITVTPEMVGDGAKKYPRIGVAAKPSEPRRVSMGESFVLGGKAVGIYFSALGDIVRKGQLKSAVGGPIKTFSYVNEARQQAGGEGVLLMFGQISLSLGLFNLFPIPILDGGHLALMALEAIRRRKLNAGQTQAVFATGFAILVVLFLYVSFKDVFLH